MITINSINNISIRISDERMNHITSNHPEMNNSIDRICKTIKNPDLVTLGDNKELLAIKLFSKSPVTENKYLVAVYKEIANDGFLITAYYTRNYNQNRKTVWKQ